MVVLAILLGLTDSEAGEFSGGTAPKFRLMKLDEATVFYKHYHPAARHPLFYDSTPKESLNLGTAVDFAEVIGWDSTVQSMTNQSQYYMVGLQMRLYLRVTQHLEVGYYHQSQHLLDHTYPFQRFPVEDAWTVQLNLYRARPGRPSVF